MTTFAAFLQSLDEPDPPARLAGPLLALWYAGKGEWETAHIIVMNDDSREAAWVHASLHRQEGDLGNACHWYSRAEQPIAEGPLKAERQAIAAALVGEHWMAHTLPATWHCRLVLIGISGCLACGS